MARKTLTPEERDAKRAEDRQRVVDALTALQTSDGWRAWIRVRRAFRSYSPLNQLLIASQMPDATRVAGFSAWLKLGYCVRKGETGIRIWGPMPPTKRQLEEWRKAGADPKERPRTRFQMVSVFDRSQVDPLPAPSVPTPLDVSIEQVELDGDDLAWAWPLLVAFGDQLQVPIALEDLPVGGPDGYFTRRGGARIRVAERLTVNARVSVAVHEVAHALVAIDRQENPPADDLTYAAEELVVETVAHLVCGALGVDTSVSSLPYLASWAAEAKVETIEQQAKTIDALARRIEDALIDADGRPLSAPQIVDTPFGTVTILPGSAHVEATVEQLRAWADQPGSQWPGSVLYDAEDGVKASYDDGGLYDMHVAMALDVPSEEFDAWARDALREALPQEHPAYFVAVGQFAGAQVAA